MYVLDDHPLLRTPRRTPVRWRRWRSPTWRRLWEGPRCTIAHVGTDNSASVAAPATLTVAKPTGVALDSSHRLVLTIGGGQPGGVCGSYTAPAGWTAVGSVVDVAGAAGHITGQVWHAAGDVVNLGFTKSGSVTDVGWVMVAFSGVDTTTPIDATGTANSSTASATLTTNAVTVATDQAWHLIGVTDWNSGAYSATSFTVVASPTTHEQAGLLYNTTPKAVGTTGTVVVTAGATGTNQAIIGVPFALRPAASAAGPILQDLMHRPGFMPIPCM